MSLMRCLRTLRQAATTTRFLNQQPAFINYCTQPKQPLGQVETKRHIFFTCKKCLTRNSKQMSRVAYEKGVVIMECSGCKNNHLIADNLGWFTDLNGKRNIEEILAEKGERVIKIDVGEFITT